MSNQSNGFAGATVPFRRMPPGPSRRMPPSRVAVRLPPPPPKKKKHRRHVSHGPKKAGAGVRSDINVTPLVDVVLVLLIIFMVVTPMLHRGPDLELPKTKNHSSRQDTGEQIVVSVKAEGVYVEADKVELDKLGGMIEKELKSGARPVNVKADTALKFGEVRKVLEAVQAGGAAAVNMETKEVDK